MIQISPQRRRGRRGCAEKFKSLSLRVLRVLCASAVIGSGAQAQVERLEEKTVARIRAFDEAFDGVLGAAAIDLTNGRTLGWQERVVCPSASTIKVPVMAAVYRDLKPDRPVALSPKDLIGGSPNLTLLLRRGPATLTVRELVAAMIETSDNTAANALIDLAGMPRVNALLDEYGLTATRLRRRMLDGAAARRGDDNTSSPLELARIAELVYTGKWSADLASMKRVEAGVRRAVPANVEVASKPGEVPGARCELAIVYLPKRPFALGIMSTFIRNHDDPIPTVAALLYAHYERLAKSNRYGNRLE